MIPWKEIKHFNPENPADHILGEVEDLINPSLIFALDRYREVLGHPVYPSPLKEAWVRTDVKSRTSRHYAVNRKSDAGDVFPDCDIREAWTVAVQYSAFGGVGVYFDTEFRGIKWPMLHLDLRPTMIPLWWARWNGEYIYPHSGADERHAFFKLLAHGEL